MNMSVNNMSFSVIYRYQSHTWAFRWQSVCSSEEASSAGLQSQQMPDLHQTLHTLTHSFLLYSSNPSLHPASLARQRHKSLLCTPWTPHSTSQRQKRERWRQGKTPRNRDTRWRRMLSTQTWSARSVLLWSPIFTHSFILWPRSDQPAYNGSSTQTPHASLQPHHPIVSPRSVCIPTWSFMGKRALFAPSLSRNHQTPLLVSSTRNTHSFANATVLPFSHTSSTNTCVFLWGAVSFVSLPHPSSGPRPYPSFSVP